MNNLDAVTTVAPNVNVRMEFRNVRTGEIVNLVEGHNRVLKSGILGLIRFINGEFNTSTPEQIQNYIPRYFAFGSNVATKTSAGGVTTEVTVNDTRLLSELDVPRTRLTQRNVVTNRYNDPYIKLTIRHYIPVNAYVGESLAEAGLFTDETGNNAWARITFDRFIKDEETVVDVTWEITIVSIESENEAYVSIDKQDLLTSMENSLNRISVNYPAISDLCVSLRQGIIDFGRSDVSQVQIDNDTQKIEELTYPLDSFVPITEPVSISLGSVVKYNISKSPTITAGSYPCGNYLELNDNTFDMFGIFTNDGVKTVIGYARMNITTGLYEYSNTIYESGIGWDGVNELGIKSVDEKITKITSGQFIYSGSSVVINDWNWSTDWLIKE